MPLDAHELPPSMAQGLWSGASDCYICPHCSCGVVPDWRGAAPLRCTGCKAALELQDGLGVRQRARPATITIETVETFLAAGEALRIEHGAEVGKPPTFNLPLALALEATTPSFLMTARHDGQMIGYIVMVVAPTLVAEAMTTAVLTTFYVTPVHRGRTAIRLMDAAIGEAWARGADDVILVAGIVGEGPRLDALFLRRGAVPHARHYRLVRPES